MERSSKLKIGIISELYRIVHVFAGMLGGGVKGGYVKGILEVVQGSWPGLVS